MNQQAQKLYHNFNLSSHKQYSSHLKCSFGMYKTLLQACIPHGPIACRNYTGTIFLLVCCWRMAHNTLNKSILHCENRFLAFFFGNLDGIFFLFAISVFFFKTALYGDDVMCCDRSDERFCNYFLVGYTLLERHSSFKTLFAVSISFFIDNVSTDIEVDGTFF